jgi:hypothetical protein
VDSCGLGRSPEKRKADCSAPVSATSDRPSKMQAATSYGMSNINGMRPREVWFWLGAGFLTLGAVLAAVAIAYFTKETHYSLSTGPQMVMAYAAFALAFLCFLRASQAGVPGCDGSASPT